jgi:hypothetical protein
MRDDTDVSMLTVVGLIMCCVVNVIVRTLRRVLSLGDWVTGLCDTEFFNLDAVVGFATGGSSLF